MKIKSFVMTRLKARMSLPAQRISRIMTGAAMMRLRMRLRPILTMVSLMPCLMICLVTMISLLSREVDLFLEVRVRPDLHHGGFLQYHRDHRDHRDQLQQLSLGLRGEDFTIVSWEVVRSEMMKYFKYLITIS